MESSIPITTHLFLIVLPVVIVAGAVARFCLGHREDDGPSRPHPPGEKA